jgi:copper oxidase (laccase) domain-containing protein
LKSKPILEFKLPKGKLCIYISKPDFDIIEVKQTHSDININCDDATETTEADGLISISESHSPLAIKTADCLPIVVLGNNGSALVHAGWKGIASKIFLKSEILNLDPYYFFIGPSIQKESFEVTEEFILNFPDGNDYYQNSHFDLQAYVKDQILDLLPHAIIEDSGIDTHGHNALHSYRFSQTNERNWNILFSDKNLVNTL